MRLTAIAFFYKTIIMNNKEFFEKEERFNRDKWSQADGANWQVGGGEYLSEPNFNNFTPKTPWLGSDGFSENENQQSMPYIIQVVNSCASAAVANVEIGNAYANRMSGNALFHNFNQSTLISITSTITDVDYIEFLAASENEPFTVGKTMIISSNSGQIEQTVQVKNKTAAGSGAFFVISSTLSPFQDQTDRIIDNTSYVFDGYTSFKFNQVNAGATVTTRFYLKNKFNAKKILTGLPGIDTYNEPDLIGIR